MSVYNEISEYCDIEQNLLGSIMLNYVESVIFCKESDIKVC